ncbi:MAG: T9SS type A sorting domain-containing protein [Bacteroidota bacterium]
MKKLVLLSVVLFIVTTVNSQTNFYQNLYDNYSTGMDMSTSIRFDQSQFYYTVSGRMEALLVMYENTRDVKYLQRFLWNANRVFNRRDDRRDNVSPSEDAAGNIFVNITTYNRIANPTWSTKRYNTACPRYDSFGGDEDWHNDNYLHCPEEVCIEIPHLIGNANIIYSFVKFYNIIAAGDSTLQNEVFNFYTQSEAEDSTFLEIANDLLTAAEETFNFFEPNWDDTLNAYRDHLETGSEIYVPLDYKGSRLPLNVQSSMGRVLIELHKAAMGTPDEIFYYNRIKQLASYVYVATNKITTNNSKRWTYWGYQDPKPNAYDNGEDPEVADPARLLNPLREDISHSSQTVVFPYECYENGFSEFSATDIQQFANTFKFDIYDDVLILNDGIYNSFTTLRKWNFKNDSNTFPSTVTKAPTTFLYTYWMKYAAFDPEIYQMLNDFNTSQFYPTLISPEMWSGNLKRPLTVAHLHQHQQLFAPIAANHNWGPASNWVAVTGGNFDDDPEDEFLHIRNFDNYFRIQEYTDNNTFANVASLTTYSGSSGGTHTWAGCAAGDFFGDMKDEIVAVCNNSDLTYNGFYIFSVTKPTINEIEYSGTWGPDSDWVGVAAGDLMNGGKDEFVLARNHLLQLRLYSYNSGVRALETIYSLNTPSALPAGTTIAGIAAGNVIDSSPGEELVVLVNSPVAADNGFYIFTIDNTTGAFTLETIINDTGWDANSDWTTITIGNFEGATKDQILAHRNLDSEYKLLTINETTSPFTLEHTQSEYFISAQANNNIFASGNFCIDDLDFNGTTDIGNINDELIVLRRTDAGMIMYAHTSIVNGSTSRAAASAESSLFENPNEISNEIKIYPNPTKGILTIDVTNDIATIHINNLLGETIKTQIQKNTVDLSSLAKGVYILTVELTNGKIITKKIIKN